MLKGSRSMPVMGKQKTNLNKTLKGTPVGDDAALAGEDHRHCRDKRVMPLCCSQMKLGCNRGCPVAGSSALIVCFCVES